MTRLDPLPRRQSLRLTLLVAASLTLLAACAGLPPATDTAPAASSNPGAYSPG